MEIKVGDQSKQVRVGQWVRTNNNTIHEVLALSDGMFGDFMTSHTKNSRLLFFKDEVKVADTPQELIKIGDMVTDKNEEVTYVVDHIEVRNGNELWFGIISYQSKIVCSMDEISEIWTRTSDNTYTRQWIKES